MKKIVCISIDSKKQMVSEIEIMPNIKSIKNKLGRKCEFLAYDTWRKNDVLYIDEGAKYRHGKNYGFKIGNGETYVGNGLILNCVSTEDGDLLNSFDFTSVSEVTNGLIWLDDNEVRGIVVSNRFDLISNLKHRIAEAKAADDKFIRREFLYQLFDDIKLLRKFKIEFNKGEVIEVLKNELKLEKENLVKNINSIIEDSLYFETLTKRLSTIRFWINEFEGEIRDDFRKIQNTLV